MANSIINETNITTETRGIIYIKEHKNIVIQNEITVGVNDSLEIRYYGTIFDTATVGTSAYWVDITDFLFKEEYITVNNETHRSMGIIDTNCPFVQIKVIVTVVSADPDNKVEIYYDC
jgi:hypothetical protein